MAYFSFLSPLAYVQEIVWIVVVCVFFLLFLFSLFAMHMTPLDVHRVANHIDLL